MQISNRIKSKGLQKLRWFCQMCQKQCRDENGFKCHLNSESHKRQMEIFGQNADRVIAGYSEEFEADFMELMRRSHPRTRVAAKNVYNEFIADKYHIHMNSTKWFTLTEFVKYLGKTGIPQCCCPVQSCRLCSALCSLPENCSAWAAQSHCRLTLL